MVIIIVLVNYHHFLLHKLLVFHFLLLSLIHWNATCHFLPHACWELRASVESAGLRNSNSSHCRNSIKWWLCPFHGWCLGVREDFQKVSCCVSVLKLRVTKAFLFGLEISENLFVLSARWSPALLKHPEHMVVRYFWFWTLKTRSPRSIG